MENQDTCFLCERDVNCAASIELSWGNDSIDINPESGGIPANESQGCFPVGSTCIKKLQKIAKRLGTTVIPYDEYKHLRK